MRKKLNIRVFLTPEPGEGRTRASSRPPTRGTDAAGERGPCLWNLEFGPPPKFLDLFLTSFGPFALWTFQYAAGFRGPGILIKRATIVDLLPRGSEVQISDKTSEKG